MWAKVEMVVMLVSHQLMVEVGKGGKGEASATSAILRRLLNFGHNREGGGKRDVQR
jgi:hypothetical protein